MPDAPPLLSPLGPRLSRIKRIAVLRGGGLGDVLFALPAIDALAHAYPKASIELLGVPMHAELFAGRGPVAAVHELPFTPGVRPDAQGGAAGPDQLFEFFDSMRAREFDLAVQVHGGGANSNPFALQLGARTTIGLQADDAPALDRVVPYRYYQHEMLRALEVVALVGAQPVTLEPRLRRTAEEVERGAKMRAQLCTSSGSATRPLVVIHPGASDARRRWPEEHFAQIAERAIADGACVAVIGDESERNLAAAVVAQVGNSTGSGEAGIHDLAGKLSLRDLIALLGASDVTLGNDSGPRHLAQAVGCPTVSVYWVGNLINAGPLTRTRDRVHLGWTTDCPTCSASQVGGVDERCEHDPSFVADVRVDDVYADVATLLTTSESTSSHLPRNLDRP